MGSPREICSLVPSTSRPYVRNALCTETPEAQASRYNPLRRRGGHGSVARPASPGTAFRRPQRKRRRWRLLELRGLRPSPVGLCVQVLCAPSKLIRAHQKDTTASPFRYAGTAKALGAVMPLWWTRRALPPRPTRCSLSGCAASCRIQPSPRIAAAGLSAANFPRRIVVEASGFEPLTFCLQSSCSPS